MPSKLRATYLRSLTFYTKTQSGLTNTVSLPLRALEEWDEFVN
jgi:hypothetical protein